MHEGTKITASRDVDIRTKDAIDAVTVAATAGVNKGGLSVSGFAAVADVTGRNALSIDDEVDVTAGENGKINILGERNDSIQTVAGGITVASGESGSNAAAGAGIAVNLGSVENQVAIENNDAEGSAHQGQAGTFKAGSVSVNAGSDININAVGAAGQAATSGTKDKDAKDVASNLNSKAGDSMTAASERIQNQTADALAQNSQESASDLEGLTRTEQNAPEAGNAETPDIATDKGKEEARKAGSGLNLAAAGSFAWNDFGTVNALRIGTDLGSYTFATEQLNVESVTNKWVGAFAGAAAVSAVRGKDGANQKQSNVGIGGAVAVNNGTFANTLDIRNLTTSASVINLHSLVNGTTIAEALGIAVAAGSSSVNAGIGAGVSVNLVDNTVSAKATNLRNTASESPLVLDLAAWSGETQITGGTNVDVAAGSTSASAAVGASVAVADIENKISAELRDSALKNAGQVNVKALASLTQVNTAVGANVAQSKGTAAAISGAVVSAGIDNIVKAEAVNSSIETTASAGQAPQVAIVASDAGTDEGEAAHAYAELAKGMEGLFNVSGKTPMTGSLLNGLTLQTSDQTTDTENINKFIDDADMTQVSVALGVGVAVGGSSGAQGAGAAGIVVTDLANRFKANSSGLTIAGEDGFEFAQEAFSGVSTVNVAAGVGVAAGGGTSLGLSGSVVVGAIDQTAESSADHLTLDARNGELSSAIAAANKAHSVNVAGGVTTAIGSAGAGVGAAVVVTNTSNTANASLSNSSITGGTGQTNALTVSAENAAETWDAAANATVSNNVALAGSFARNNVSNNALAGVTDSTVTLLDALTVRAADDSELWTLAGSVGVSFKPGGSLAGGIAVTHGGGATEAKAENLTLTGSDAADAPKTDLTVEALARDYIRTMTLGAAVGGVALSNATAVNEVERSVEAALSGLKVRDADGNAWTGARQLDAVTVGAISDAQISNLGIVIGGAGTGALGVGFSQNKVQVDVSAKGSGLNALLDTLDIHASSMNDIDTIAVGATGAGNAALGGSTADNLSGGDVEALLDQSDVAASGAVAVHAESDDAIGTYSGQLSAAAGAAVGVSMAFAERQGTTSARVTGSTITETGETSGVVKVSRGIETTDINNDVVEDVSTGASLAEKRLQDNVGGIRVSATSTTTYKTLAINAGAAGNAAAAGSANSITHGGKTSAIVSGSTLTSQQGEAAVLAGDYANAFTSLTTVGAASTAAAALGVSLVDSAHQTSAAIEKSTVEADKVRLEAEAKEGFSSILINAGAAMTAAGAATASDVTQGSSVATMLTGSTIEGKDYAQKADYYGSIANVGVNASLSSTASLGANVALNTNKAMVSSLVDGSIVKSTDTVDVTASRRANIKQYGATAAGSLIAGISAAVVINTIEGESAVKIANGSKLGEEVQLPDTGTKPGETTGTIPDKAPDKDEGELKDVTPPATTDPDAPKTSTTARVNVAAENNDKIEIVTANASLGLSVGVGATVVVNKMNGAAGTRVENASVTAENVSIASKQNRTIEGTVATASGGILASLGANIVATAIGEYQDGYDKLLGKEVKKDGTDPAGQLAKFENEASGLTTSGLKGSAQGYKADSTDSTGSGSQTPVEPLIKDLSGTQTQLVDADIKAKNHAEVAALEDTTNNAGVDLTLGSGNAGALSLGAGVATLNRSHNAGVTVSGGNLTAETTEVAAKLGSNDHITVWQASAGLASGVAAYAEVTNQGGAAVRFLNNASITNTGSDRGLTGGAINASRTTLDVNGIAAGLVAAGGIIGKINDASHATVEMNQTRVAGEAALSADRGQTLSVKTMAGYGGAAAGVGASSEIVDSGAVTVSLAGVTTENAAKEAADRFAVDANSHADMTVDAGAAGGALGAAVGVVEGSISESGKVAYTVKDSRFNTSEVSLTGSAGNTSNALSMTGKLAGYGGALLAGVGVNKLSFRNDAQVDFNLSGTNFGESTAANLFAGGNALYSGKSDAIYAGAIASGNSALEVAHGVNATMNLTGNNSTAGLINAKVDNIETVKMLGESAGGGLLVAESASGDALKISHEDKSNARINVYGGWHSADSINLAAFSQSALKLSADNTKGGLGAFSSAMVINRQEGESRVTIHDNADVKADESLLMSAKSDWSVGAYDGRSHVVNSEVYGGITGNGIKYTGTNSRSNIIEIGRAKLDAGDLLSAESFSQGKTDIRVKTTVGALAGVAMDASLSQDLDITNRVNIKDGANLRTRQGASKLILAASASDDLFHEAVSDFSGAFAGSVGSTTNVDYVRTNAVDVASGSNILAGGEMYLRAGENAAGYDAYLLGIHRAEVFAKAGIALPKAGLNLNTTLTNTVNVAGSALSVATAAVNADSGWWLQQTDSVEHYWGSLGKDNSVVVAQKSDGESHPFMHEVNELTVSGKLEAGVLTGADITIDGILGYNDESVEVSGGAALDDWRKGLTVSVGEKDGELTEIEKQFQKEIYENITFGEQDAQNDYWNRYEQLQKIISDYSGSGAAADQDAVTAYRSELEGLRALMLQKGFAYQDKDGNFIPMKSQKELVVSVKDISVSGGSIEITAGSVKGGGSIKANSVDGISITNSSNANLKVGNIHIQEKGGSLFFNGAAADASTFQNAGFSGSVAGESSAGTPAINIVSHYAGQPFTVTVKDAAGQPVGTEVVSPKTNITVSGDIANLAGNLSIKAVDGDLFSLAGISASGQSELSAKGAVTQSYTAGVTEVGGRVQNNSVWASQIAAIRDNLAKGFSVGTGGNASYALPDASGSAIVAGGQIIISGELLNLNGLVQSGFSKYEISLTENELDSKIAQAKQNCTGICTLIEGGAVRDGDTYKYQIGLSYDTVNDRLVLDDVTPTGGNVFISGKIASTGNGKIYAVDGTAYVNIDAADYDLQTGKISTGNASGLIKITDTFKANGDVAAVVTEYRSGGAQTYNIDKEGNTINGSLRSTSSDSYDPKKGLIYLWTEGYSSLERETTTTKYEGKWWGTPKWDHEEKSKPYVESLYNSALSSSATITDSFVRPGGAGNQDFFYYAWTNKYVMSAEHTRHDTGVTSSGFLGFYKHRTVTDIVEKGGKSIGTFTVKADQQIKVGMLKDANANTINLKGRNILLGGNLTTDSGTVDINAAGNISTLSSQYGIAGTSRVDLAAGGDIGSEGRALRLTGGEGTLTLSAKAGGSLHLDARSLNAGRNVEASELEAGGTLSFATRDAMHVGKLRGNDITLTSDNSGITVDDLVQGSGKTDLADQSYRFDAAAKGNISVTVTQGSLGLGLVETGADVVLELQNGTLYDAVKTDQNTVSDNDRLKSWIASGFINEDGSSRSEAMHLENVEKQKTAVKGEFTRYETYAAHQKEGRSLEGWQQKDYDALKAKYEGCASADEAVSRMASQEGSALYNVMNEKLDSWTANDLLYSVADTIVNGTATSITGSANIKANDVTIRTPGGSVGSVDDPVTGSLSGTPEERLRMLQYLSKADVGDFSVSGDQVTVALKAPITIGATGSVNIESNKSVFIETPREGGYGFQVGEIVSKTGDVRVTSGNGITKANETANAGFVSAAGTVTLRGGLNSVGSDTGAIRIHAGDWTAVSSQKDIFIESVDENNQDEEDFTIYSIAGGGDVSISAKNLYAYDGVKADGSYDDFAELGYIGGKALHFNVKGDFGKASVAEKSNALRVGSSSTIYFEPGVQNLWLHAMGEGNLGINDIKASGLVDIVGDDAVTVGLNGQAGGIKGSSVTVSTQNNLAVNGNIESASEARLASAAGSVSVDGNVDGTSVDIDAAGGGISVKGNIESSAENGQVTLDAANDVSVTGSVTAKGLAALTAGLGASIDGSVTGTTVDLDATGGNISVKGNVESTAENGQVTLDAAQALSVTGNVTAKGQVALTAGSNAAVDGSVESTNDLVRIAAQDGITIGENAKGSIRGTSIDLDAAGGDISIHGSVESTAGNGQVTLDAAQALSVAGSITGQGLVALTAGGNASVDGSVESTGDAVRITAQTGRITIGEKAEGSVTGTSVDLDAAGGDISVHGSVESTAGNGQVTLDAAEAISVVGDIAGKGKVALTAGLGAAIDGSVRSEQSTVAILAKGGDITLGSITEGARALGHVSGTSVALDAQKGRIYINGGVEGTDAGGHAKLKATDDIIVKGSVKSAGFAELAADSDISVEGNVTSAGKTLLTAGDGVTVAGKVESSADAVTVAAKNESIHVDGDIISNGQDGKADLSAGKDVAVTGSVVSRKDVRLEAQTGNVTIGTKDSADKGFVTADGSVDITADQTITIWGDVTSNGKSDDSGITMTSKSDAILLDEKSSITAAKNVAMTAARSVALKGGAITAGAKAAVKAGAEGIDFTGLELHAHDANITSTGHIALDAAQLSVTKNASIEAGGNLGFAQTELTAEEAVLKGAGITAPKAVVQASAGATVKAGADGIDFTGLNLQAHDAKITSTGHIALNEAQLAVTKNAAIDAGGNLGFAQTKLTAEEAVLKGAGITAAKADVEATKHISLAAGQGGIAAEEARFSVTTTEETGSILLESAGDANLGDAAFTINKGDLTIAAENSVDLKGVDFAIKDGGMSIDAKSGDMDMSGAQGLELEKLDLSAGGSMLVNDLDVTVDESFNISAGRNVEAEGISVKVKGASGDVNFNAQNGAVNLANAQINASGDGGSIGDVSVTSGSEADLTNVFAGTEAFTAENLTVKAGGKVTLGDASQSITATTGSVTIEAASLDGNRLAAGSSIEAGENVALNLTEAGLTVNDQTNIAAEKSASITARDDVALQGDILVTGNEAVLLKALEGDLSLTGAVTVGDETIGENAADVTLYAGKSLTQSAADGDAGVRGRTLTATARGGDVALPAISDASIGSDGNAFTEMTVDSAGSVYLGSNGRDTKVTLNKDRGGKVTGDLKAYGQMNAFEFTNDVSVEGDALLYGSAVFGTSLEAGKALQIVTAGFDGEVGENRLTGVRFTGSLKAHDHVGIFTDAGDIMIQGSTNASKGYIDVYRLATEKEGTVTMGGGRGGYTITVFNGSGDIRITDLLYGEDAVYAFTESGRTEGSRYLLSAVHKQAAVSGAGNIGSQIDLEHLKDMTAFDLMPGLPHVVIDRSALERADNDRINPFVYPAIDTLSPNHRYFFLHLRPDAAANKAAASEEEEEGQVLEEGLPARGKGLIRDLREPEKEKALTIKGDDKGWILSQTD